MSALQLNTFDNTILSWSFLLIETDQPFGYAGLWMTDTLHTVESWNDKSRKVYLNFHGFTQGGSSQLTKTFDSELKLFVELRFVFHHNIITSI